MLIVININRLVLNKLLSVVETHSLSIVTAAFFKMRSRSLIQRAIY